jgi:ABC-type transport system substrate-binding protein
VKLRSVFLGVLLTSMLLVTNSPQLIRESQADDATAKIIIGGEPFEDPKVQEAFLYAIDWVTVMDYVCHGQDIPVTVELWQNGLVTDDARGWAYDPEHAWALLGEAGYDNGFPLYLLYLTERVQFVVMAGQMKPYLDTVLMSSTLVPVSADEADDLIAQMLASGGAIVHVAQVCSSNVTRVFLPLVAR